MWKESPQSSNLFRSLERDFVLKSEQNFSETTILLKRGIALCLNSELKKGLLRYNYINLLR